MCLQERVYKHTHTASRSFAPITDDSCVCIHAAAVFIVSARTGVKTYTHTQLHAPSHPYHIHPLHLRAHHAIHPPPLHLRAPHTHTTPTHLRTRGRVLILLCGRPVRGGRSLVELWPRSRSCVEKLAGKLGNVKSLSNICCVWSWLCNMGRLSILWGSTCGRICGAWDSDGGRRHRILNIV